MKKYASELEDFPDLLRACAQSRKILAAIVEKDYYLTRALRALAANHTGQIVLKGGTSLSKGWQLLQRFSEDIDLLVRDEGDTGKGARHSRLRKCARTIEQTEGFKLPSVLASETGVHRKVSFSYSSVATDLPGLSKTVLLEAGYRGNAAEAVSRDIQSMLGEFATAHGRTDLAADLSSFGIETQSLLRTFVEKLFAAHAAYVKNFAAEGKARHYYDLFKMCQLEEINACVGTEDYQRCVQDVRKFSQRDFPDQALPESDSLATSPAFQPDGNGLKSLEQNYNADASLFFGDQPSINDVIGAIGKVLRR